MLRVQPERVQLERGQARRQPAQAQLRLESARQRQQLSGARAFPAGMHVQRLIWGQNQYAYCSEAQLRPSEARDEVYGCEAECTAR